MTSLVLFIYRLLDLYQSLIVIEVLLSWVASLTNNAVVRDIFEALAKLVEPYIGLFRRVIPPIAGLDFSPVFALLVLQLVQKLLLA